LAEILNPQRVLRMLHGFGPLRRVILATPGTLQGTLSAWFGTQVDVVVRSQSDLRDHKHFVREVDLVCRDPHVVACRARSEIDVESEEIRTLIQERRIGLGQISVGLGVHTAFDLEAAGTSPDGFWRRYTLEGPGFLYRIHEAFPGALFPETGLPRCPGSAA
jgi:hypothetical protein